MSSATDDAVEKSADQEKAEAEAAETKAAETESDESDVPEWDDEYIDRVADQIKFSYDLEKDRVVEAGSRRERFPLYGRMEITSQKHFLHPALSYGRHEAVEHLFARRESSVAVADLEAYVGMGHSLADEWIEASEEHFSTDFTFALVVPSIPDDVRSFVSGFSDRTLIKYGYHGHYEVNLVVAAPDAEDVVASESADVARAFALWEDDDGESSSGLLSRLLP